VRKFYFYSQLFAGGITRRAHFFCEQQRSSTKNQRHVSATVILSSWHVNFFWARQSFFCQSRGTSHTILADNNFPARESVCRSSRKIFYPAAVCVDFLLATKILQHGNRAARRAYFYASNTASARK
jgi:hypothetical protein